MPYDVLSMKLFTVKEGCEALGIPTKTMKRYLREGMILGAQIEKSWFISEASLKAFKALESERQKVRDEALRLKRIFDQFLKDGDITQGYYDRTVERLSEFL